MYSKLNKFKVGDRVISVAGDLIGDRGFIIEIIEGDKLPITWVRDDGGRISCTPDRVDLAPPNPPEWFPSCGDLVRVLVGEHRGVPAYVIDTETTKVAVDVLWPWGNRVIVSCDPQDLELYRAAKPRKPNATYEEALAEILSIGSEYGMTVASLKAIGQLVELARSATLAEKYFTPAPVKPKL